MTAAEWTDYESETLRQAREMLLDWFTKDGGDGDDLRGLNVRLEGEPGEAMLLVTFMSPDRPGCLFIYTWPLHGWNDPRWPDEPDEEVPDNQVTLLWASLMEDLGAAGYGLPSNCVPGMVVELGRRRVELELEIAVQRVIGVHARAFEYSEAEMRDKLAEATTGMGKQHLTQLQRWTDALNSAMAARQQKGRPNTPLDP